MSSKHRKSGRKTSSAKSYNAPDFEYGEEAGQSTWPTPTFLFQVDELPVNENEEDGGRTCEVDEEGRWLPPNYPNGYYAASTGGTFRWDNGRIALIRNWPWGNGRYLAPDGRPLAVYAEQTVFWANSRDKFKTATGNASEREMPTSDFPGNRWYSLTFRHEDGNLSRVEESAEHNSLAGIGAHWINDFGLQGYTSHRYPRPSGGLAGKLTTIIALMAFTCTQEDFPTVLVVDHAWYDRRWHSHQRERPPYECRGFVVRIYLDPENTQGSTRDTIEALEWSGAALVH